MLLKTIKNKQKLNAYCIERKLSSVVAFIFLDIAHLCPEFDRTKFMQPSHQKNRIMEIHAYIKYTHQQVDLVKCTQRETEGPYAEEQIDETLRPKVK